tara:strand:- start:1506 stop:2438 length:933 start_codon:yes stop_codon:yes gene_type:complete
MGGSISKDQQIENKVNIEEMLAKYSYDLDTEVMLIFEEEEEEQQNQLIVFPHIQDTNLNSISKAYEKLKKDQDELKKNKEEEKKEIKSLTTRIQSTRKQIDGVFNKDLAKENITKFGDINNKLTTLKDNFSSLLSDYSITKTISPLDILKPEPTQSIEQTQSTQQQTVQKIENVGNPVININTQKNNDKDDKDDKDDISVKDILSLAKIGGRKEPEGETKFKDDPFDYIFEKFSKRELNKIGNDWNLPKTQKYNKDELINILKLMLKYKNNIKITKKELKLLSTSIQVKRTNKGYNKKTINTKLINVPII